MKIRSEAAPVGAGWPAAHRSRAARIYYGWVILAALAVTQVTSWGIVYYAFGVVLEPMRAELGWEQATLTGAFSLALLVSGFAAVPFGRVLDRHGARALMTAGSVAAALLLLGWSTVEGTGAYYGVWAGLGVAMAAILYEPAFAVLAAWFERDRAKAMLLLTIAGGLASVVFVPVTSVLTGRFGWRSAIAALAVLLAVVTVPAHALVLRRRPADLGFEPDGREPHVDSEQRGAAAAGVSRAQALGSASFWGLTAAFWLMTFCTMAVSVHLLPLLAGRGLGAGPAVAAAALAGGMQLPGRILLAPLERLVSPRLLVTAVFALQGLGIVVLALAWSPAAVYLFAVLFGSGAGAATLIRATLVARLYGSAHYGSISGVLALFVTSSRAVAPVAVSLMYGLVGYDVALWALVGASGAALAALAFTPLETLESDDPGEPRDP